jgi:hypothetical protein
MNGEILYGANEWVLGLVFLALMVSACEAGFRLGRKPGEQKTSEDTKSQVSTVEAGILAVLGLLLGFTMSMAVTRFEVRKQLVLEEAKAIGTAHLRTQLLPAAEGKEIADLLRAYTNVRVPPEGRRDIYEQIAAARQESARLRDAFWQRAVAYGFPGARIDVRQLETGKPVGIPVSIRVAGEGFRYNHLNTGEQEGSTAARNSGLGGRCNASRLIGHESPPVTQA